MLLFNLFSFLRLSHRLYWFFLSFGGLLFLFVPVLSLFVIFLFVITLFVMMVMFVLMFVSCWDVNSLLNCCLSFRFDGLFSCLSFFFCLSPLFVFLIIFSFFVRLVWLMLFVMMLTFVEMLSFLLLLEFFGDKSYTCPIFNNLLVLSAHFDEESTVEDFPVKAVPNEVNGIDFQFEDDLK